ncbi:transposase [Mesorhizobium sp. M0138]|uniref:transposase n=1 Tax=unclassified Mesorhizobium TaxID=325217 RepID=UPI003338AFD6
MAAAITRKPSRHRAKKANTFNRLPMARDNALMISVPGVSKITSFSLAHLPELGQRSPKSIAALAGLAPFDNKSGKLNRRSQIQGGRSRVRRALYMAALGAIRACERFRTFYTAIAARSGSKKLAIIAVARKLLVVLNAIIRDKKAFA